MRACQREVRSVVIKNKIRIPSRVASKTRCAVIYISTNPSVFLICLRICMTGYASKFCIIGWVEVAISTLTPLSIMLPTIDWEILKIVVEGSGLPSTFRMAGSTLLRKLRSGMIRGSCISVIGLVTGYASIRSAIIIAIMTCCTIISNHCMCTI